MKRIYEWYSASLCWALWLFQKKFYWS